MSFAFDDGGMVPQSADPGQGQEGGIPASGAAQPAAATPQQRLATAGSMVQSLLTHGMRKHNLIGPDGKPMRVGAYAGGGLVRSFADGGFVDAQNEEQGQTGSSVSPETEGASSPDAGNGGDGAETQGAIPSVGGAQDAAAGDGPSTAGGLPGSTQGPNSFASTGPVAPSVMQYVTGADAPPDQVMDQLHGAFKRPGDTGSKAALAAVAAAGEKSADLGFSVLQGYRKRYDRARAEAAKALDMGNLDGGVAALNDAYANFPTDETASFSHDGNKIHANVNGTPYQIDPRMASELLAKGAGGHFDNQAFTGLSQPFSTLGAISTTAEKMAAQQYPGRQAAPQGGGRAPQGTQVAAARRSTNPNAASDAAEAHGRAQHDLQRQKVDDTEWARHNGGKGSPEESIEKLKYHLYSTGTMSPADIETRLDDARESYGLPRKSPKPVEPQEPPKAPSLTDRIFGGSKPAQPAAPAATPQWQAGQPIPRGYAREREKRSDGSYTGRERIVPE